MESKSRQQAYFRTPLLQPLYIAAPEDCTRDEANHVMLAGADAFAVLLP
ncbi:hypothetical protein I2I11_20610 [Pontibacter sp. 172403-2]|nr:hypothetical protein [Pontibacter sp. 172403-2]MBF9255712.1 hypothetical protein [Pontibacter sp. 172403-2]